MKEAKRRHRIFIVPMNEWFAKMRHEFQQMNQGHTASPFRRRVSYESIEAYRAARRPAATVSKRSRRCPRKLPPQTDSMASADLKRGGEEAVPERIKWNGNDQ
jgi:hypothetical protein